nr:MAG TPA: hypothetical protein [Caudoviricetes sp.]
MKNSYKPRPDNLEFLGLVLRIKLSKFIEHPIYSNLVHPSAAFYPIRFRIR